MSLLTKRKKHDNKKISPAKLEENVKHSDHVLFSEMPPWMGDNEFLLSCHRPELKSFTECIKSVFSVHSETGNIWTHLLGFICFVIITIIFYVKPFCDYCSSDILLQDKLIFLFFLIGAIICLLFSAMFHTFYCHSEHVYKIFSKLDYAGISLLTVGSFIPWIYYGFYCNFLCKVVYISSISVIGVGTVLVTMVDKFSTPAYRPIRAALFVCIGLSAVVPLTHSLLMYGWEEAKNVAGVDYGLIIGCLYIIGAVMYAARVPERFLPGTCDLWLQSHQIFHLFVVAAALVSFYAMKQVAFYRLTEVGLCDR